MDIYQALSQDHRVFETLLDRLVAASRVDNDDWKAALDALRRGLIAHARAEEAVFYNALREVDVAKSLIAHSYAEHATAEGAIRTLSAAKAIDANWTSLVEKLNKDLRHHIKEEESRIYAAARQAFSEQEAQQIGAAFERMKQETAKGGESIVASTVELVANLLPPRMTETFRKGVNKRGAETHAPR